MDQLGRADSPPVADVHGGSLASEGCALGLAADAALKIRTLQVHVCGFLDEAPGALLAELLAVAINLETVEFVLDSEGDLQYCIQDVATEMLGKLRCVKHFAVRHKSVDYWPELTPSLLNKYVRLYIRPDRA